MESDKIIELSQEADRENLFIKYKLQGKMFLDLLSTSWASFAN